MTQIYYFIFAILVFSGLGYLFFSKLIKELMNPQTDLESKSIEIIKSSLAPASEQVIVTYKNCSFDITDFVLKHPGGKAILLQNNGKDVERLMAQNEHSEEAYKILEKYKIK